MTKVRTILIRLGELPMPNAVYCFPQMNRIGASLLPGELQELVDNPAAVRDPRTGGKIFTRHLFALVFAFLLVNQVFGQARPNSVNQASEVKSGNDDVSLNDRRLSIVEMLASSDDGLAHYRSEFQRADAEGKIDVFVTAWIEAAGKLTEVAESRVSTRSYKGVLGALVRMMGVPVVDTVLTAGGGGTAFNKKREGELANIGLENAKAVVTRFLGAGQGTAFEAGRPADKTILLLRALKKVISTGEQPNPYVIWGNDNGSPGQRGAEGKKVVGMMFGTADSRYLAWPSLNRGERDLALTAALDHYLDRAIEAVQDETGMKAQQLALDVRGGPRETLAEKLRRADPSGRLSKIYKADLARIPVREDNRTYVRAFGTEPKTVKDAEEAQRSGEIMAMAWRFGYFLLLGMDELKIQGTPAQ